MTFVRVARLALWVSVWPSAQLTAQAWADTSAIEVAAVRAMLARGAAAGPVGVEPALARHGSAPGVLVRGSARSAARSQALVTALGAGARILRFAEARRCEGMPCPLTAVAAHLTLSEPLIDRGTAVITVTRVENTGGLRPATSYETVLFTLRRHAGRWVVVREEQLGIS